MTYRILRQHGSPTMWFVEGRSVRCINPKCNREFSRETNVPRNPGDPWPKCRSLIEEVWHTVDEAGLIPIGECDCKGFQLHPKRRLSVKNMTPAQRWEMSYQQQEEARCHHIKAVRNQSHNDTLRAHDDNYGATGRYVVLMNDDQYHVHQKTERVVRDILIAHGAYGDGSNLDKLTRQKCLELLQPLDRRSNVELSDSRPL